VTDAIKCGGDADTVASIAGSLIGINVGREGIPDNWRRGLFDYPLNETSLVKIANDNLSRSVLKELIIFPFRQSVLFILIISHLIFRMIGTPIILIRKKLK
jgi:hypothetical protein